MTIHSVRPPCRSVIFARAQESGGIGTGAAEIDPIVSASPGAAPESASHRIAVRCDNGRLSVVGGTIWDMRTTTQLIDEFLRYREGTVTRSTVNRDRSALDRLHTYLDADGPVILDETTGDRLPRVDGGVGLSDLVDVELIIRHFRSFLRDGLSPDDSSSEVTLRQFVLWLHRIGELDRCGYLEMSAVTRQADRSPGTNRRGRTPLTRGTVPRADSIRRSWDF